MFTLQPAHQAGVGRSFACTTTTTRLQLLVYGKHVQPPLMPEWQQNDHSLGKQLHSIAGIQSSPSDDQPALVTGKACHFRQHLSTSTGTLALSAILGMLVALAVLTS